MMEEKNVQQEHQKEKYSNDELDDAREDKIEGVQLKRTVGLTGGISFIVGAIVGSGIFISPKGVLDATGSVGLSLIVWFGAGLISLLGSLCYAELGTLIPKSGGEYAYIRSAYGNLPAFLYIWVSVILLQPSSMAVVSLTFGTYLTSLFHYCGEPVLPVRLAAITCVVTLMILNCYSTKLTAIFQIATTIAKVLALMVIIIGGIYKMANGSIKELGSGFEGSTTDGSIIALAFYDSLWAYNGWNNLNFLTEELQNPSKNLPRASVISIILVICIYLLTNVSYLIIMTKQELLDANAVAELWGERVLKSAAIIIPLSVMVSTFGAANASTFSGGRTVFSAARDGNFPEVISFLNVKRLTPIPSMLFTCSLAVTFILLGDISSLIDFFSFTAWLFYGTTFSTLLYFRVKRKNAVRPYKVPIVVPIIMILVSVYLIIAPIIKNPAIEYLYAVIFIVGGALIYFPFIHFKLKIPGTDMATVFVQLVLETAPSSKFID